MKTALYRIVLPALLVATTPAMVLALPVKVRTAGGESQMVTMCPDCNQPIACARAGDYTVAFAADVLPPKYGSGMRFQVRLTDRQGLPVTKARVALVLSMPGHEHQPKTVPLKLERDGRYRGETTYRAAGMEGVWKADVKITTPKGDVVTQAFTFSR